MTWMPIRYAADVDPQKSQMPALPASGSVSFLPMQDVGTGLFLEPSETRALEDVYDGYTYMRDGDVAIATISPSFQNGKGGVVRGAVNGVCFATTELTPLRPREGTDPRYLRYALQSESFLQAGTASLYGVAGQKRVPTQLLRDFKFWLPPLNQQGQIADFLDRETRRIDEARALISRIQQLVEERQFAAISSAIETATSQSRRLSLIARLGTGHTPDRTKPEYWEDCTIPWVTAADLSSRTEPFEALMETAQHVSELGVANSAAVVHPPGTVMLCRTASVGLVCRIGVPMATTQAFVTWTPGPDLDSEYLMFCLISMRQEWDRLKFGSTHDTIYFPDIQSVAIPYCSLDQQRQVVSRIREQLEAVKSLPSELHALDDLLRERRSALVTGAVTGQLGLEAMA
jgi:type I restriction enzyme S subunit